MPGDKSVKPAAPLVAPDELPRRSVLSDTTYEAVKQLIMDNRLAPGTRISMESLARELGVSPTPVREALARLDADGLVSKRPLAGYTVSAQLDAAAFEDLFRMRLLLEPEAARLAAARPMDPTELTQLAELTKRMVDAPTGEGYAAYREQIALDARFHDAIAAASGSALLHAAISRLHAHMHLYRLYWHSGFAVDTAAEHERIVAALAAGDPAAGARAMSAHLRASHDRLIQFTAEL